MNDEERDPILDACLDEVLGEVQAPDLTSRILAAWSARQAGAASQSGIPLPAAGTAPAVSEPIPPPIQKLGGCGPAAAFSDSASASASRTVGLAARPADAFPSSGRRARKSTAARAWTGPAVVACLLLVAAAGAVVIFRGAWSSGAGVARPDQAVPGDRLAADGSSPDRTPAAGQPAAEVVKPPRGGQLAGGAPAAVDRGSATPDRVPPHDRLPGEPERGGPFRTPPPFDVAGGTNSAAGRGAANTAASEDPLPAEQVVQFVNTQLRTSWQQYEVQPAEPATEAEWCRRVFLRILGRIPLVEELESFLADSAASKRERLVERLLHESPYVDQMADHWSGFWTNVLAGRTGGLDGNAPGDRQALQAWLRQAIVEGRPFDQVAYELISATGSTNPDAPDYNPAVHYLLINMDPRATLATTRTTQAFLGKQLQCAQCHHHPSNDWAQEQFWQFSAFFRQMRVERDDAAGHVRLVNRDFTGEGGRDAGEAEVYFERLDGKLQAAYPVFLGGEAISPSGRLEDVDRRRELARLVRSSGDLSRAVVNRVWAHFFGHGFTDAVDDMGPHSPPSHPELLEQLAGQFAAHEYDLRALLRWIALSEAFGLSSRVTAGTLADRPDAGSLPLFSRYYTRQLPPEEVYHSLELVAAARAERRTPGTEQARLDWLGQFTRNMGTDEATETSSYAGDIRQSLIIMNGPLMRQATTPRAGSVLQQVLASEMAAEEKVEHLFLAALSRQPTRRELALIGQMLASAGDLNTALQDVWWALLNSNEFILDH